MTSIQLILVAAGVFAASGIPGLFATPRSAGGERVGAIAAVAAAIIGVVGALMPDAAATLPWDAPWGPVEVALDPISRIFLLPILIVPALGTVYALGYWPRADHPGNARKLRLFYGILPAAMTLVIVARSAPLFLLAWEVMAIAAFFLVTTEDRKREARRAGWVYFVATHIGTLTLFAMFAAWRAASGSFALLPIDPAHSDPSLVRAIFILALIGFGLKAGIMPLHVWLPGAHAAAPSHVSAILSGVMLKVGVYGLVRITGLLPGAPAWWGATLLSIGAVSAIMALVFALAQQDLKRLLAYSSIENIGIIFTGLGLALLGRAADQPVWVALGMGGAMLHVWNHALFKPLLFFGAGSVLHGAGTRRMEQLGGLARRMPLTGAPFLVGAVAIGALPPLNGFVSELVIYLGLFRTLGPPHAGAWATAAAAAPALGLAGGLAGAAFAKVFGVVFLGQPRSDAAGRAHESGPSMLAPMAVLALLCLALGAFAGFATPLIDRATGAWWPAPGEGAPPLRALAPFDWLPFTSLALLGLCGAGFLSLRRAMARRQPRPGTWDCGYAAPTARMQYTGSSFSQFLGALFSWATRPRTRRPRVRGLFPEPARFRSEVPDVVLDRAVLPLARRTADFLRWTRLLQQGQVQVYVLYILLTVLVLFISVYIA